MINKNESYVRKLIEDGTREDGRGLTDFREISVKTGVIETAEGSAEVKIGNTMVLVGVKMEVKEPYPDSPNEGGFVVDAEFVPLASPDFENGPPGEEAVELARVVDRGIRESHAVDMEKLCIKEKEAAWTVHIDIHVLDHDGNLIDAASIGAMAALLDTKMPKWDADNKKIIRELKGKLPVSDKPVEITVIKIGNKLLVDPTAEEESALDARLTVATLENGELCAMQKGGDGYFTVPEIQQAVELAIDKGKELRKLL
ncbi:MAG: exosome complex protein Rrp42 [Candidatus Aenigmarchaeota archaeon]|nr:exosome complex protein Rrp42 [Candidatus Aenigmarchaeota archaeon]